MCSFHRAGDFDETRHRRDMRRTTIRDPQTPGAPGDVVQDMYRPAKEAAGWLSSRRTPGSLSAWSDLTSSSPGSSPGRRSGQAASLSPIHW
jgi:hypothetical protein